MAFIVGTGRAPAAVRRAAGACRPGVCHRGVTRRPGGSPVGPDDTRLQFVTVTVMRRCSRTACGRAALATLTYVYADQTAVLGPLATYAEPHTYDLCAGHADRLTVPQGWDVVRLVDDMGDLALADEPADDLLAVADAVRERPEARRRAAATPAEGGGSGDDGGKPGTGAAGRKASGRTPPPSSSTRAEQRANRRAHLRVLRDG